MSRTSLVCLAVIFAVAVAQQQQGQYAPMSQSSQPTRYNQYQNSNSQYPQQNQQYGQQQQYGATTTRNGYNNNNQGYTTTRFGSTTTMNPNQRFFNSAPTTESAFLALGAATVALAF
ncbi:unnamed protein product, partial [Mesorhabditis spiculigera]